MVAVSVTLLPGQSAVDPDAEMVGVVTVLTVTVVAVDVAEHPPL